MRHFFFTFLLALSTGQALADEVVVAVVKGLSYPPYFWLDPVTGERQGYLPELHRRLLAAQGHTLRYYEYDPRQPGSWDQVMGEVQLGNIDVIGGISDLKVKTPGIRSIRVPLLHAQMAIFSRRGEQQHFDDLNLSDKTGAFGLYTAPLVLREDIESNKLPVKSYRTYDQAFKWLINGDVDYWVADAYAAKAFLYHVDREHRVVETGKMFSVYPIYIGVSEQSRYSELGEGLRREIEGIHATGKAPFLLNKHMQQYLRSGDSR